MTAEDNYEHIDTSGALVLYIDKRERDGAAPSTVRSHRSQLEYFVSWFQGETDYDELSSLDIRQYKESWLRFRYR